MNLLNKFPDRLEVHFNEKNLGQANNRDKSNQLSKGKYLTYLDGDDVFLPGKISKQVKLLEENPEIAICYHNVEVFDSFTGETNFYWKERFGYGDGEIRNFIQYGNNLCSLAFMFRKKDIPTEKFSHSGQDWLYFVEVMNKGGGKYHYIDEVLARYRRHSENMTLNWEDKINGQIHTLNILHKRYPQYHSQINIRRSEVLLTKSLFFAARKEYLVAIRNLFSSLKFVFPAIWRVLRIPLREIKFFISKGGKADHLIKSLIKSE